MLSSLTSLKWSDKVPAEERRKSSKEAINASTVTLGNTVPSSKDSFAHQRDEHKRKAFRLAVDQACWGHGHNHQPKMRSDSASKGAQNRPAVRADSDTVLSDSVSGFVKVPGETRDPDNAPKINISQIKYPRFSRRVQSKSEPSHASQDTETSEEFLATVPEVSEAEEVVRGYGSLPVFFFFTKI